MVNDDLVWDGKWKPDEGGNNIAQTFKKDMVESGRKLTELTICSRTYTIAYNKNGEYHTFRMFDGEPIIVDTNGYTEPRVKDMSSSILAPSDNPFDVLSWFWSSRTGHDETKNEWSFFRKSKQNANAQEWHHLCNVYSVPKRNTGIVYNGEILANRNQSELWANEDNFYSSRCFEPYHKVTWEDGNEYDRYID